MIKIIIIILIINNYIIYITKQIKSMNILKLIFFLNKYNSLGAHWGKIITKSWQIVSVNLKKIIFNLIKNEYNWLGGNWDKSNYKFKTNYIHEFSLTNI